MLKFQRYNKNPILEPNSQNNWETEAAFNPSVVKSNSYIHLLYRAVSSVKEIQKVKRPVSTIGYKISTDGLSFSSCGQLIKPEHDWERFGCEDPRITKLDDKYFIFYTALSKYPFMPDGIKIGLAMTKNFEKINKHPVTSFNSKAMAIFPEKINGKIAAILTVDTDKPPSKICLCFFDNEAQIWSKKYWDNWYKNINSHIIPLLESKNDHIEVGAPPIKTDKGWLLFYSYIKNYFSSSKEFKVKAVLLNKDLSKIIGKSKNSLLEAKRDYEIKGRVPEVVFPSGAIKEYDNIYLYYGASDTFGCRAKIDEKTLLNNLTKSQNINFLKSKTIKNGFKRYEENPIIKPRPEFSWEKKATFNPAAFYNKGKTYIIYRAMSENNTSVFGYAESKDGVNFNNKSSYPIFKPKKAFEKKIKLGANSGCEDPRITRIGNRFYMCYTAFKGKGATRVALTSIKTKDFFNQNWKWEEPVLISRPNVFNKDACIFPKKFNGKYAFLHRPKHSIYIDFVDDLNFGKNDWLSGQKKLISPRKQKWDNVKVGIGGPPIEIDSGWLLIYHGISEPGKIYKLGVALLDKNHPEMVLKRSDLPVFEPEAIYEKTGQMANVVFPCGNILLNDDIFIYYGAGDKCIGLAKISLKNLMGFLN